MRNVFLLSFFALAACRADDGMTNDEIIAETKRCLSAGLSAQSIVRGYEGTAIIRIQCIPKT